MVRLVYKELIFFLCIWFQISHSNVIAQKCIDANFEQKVDEYLVKDVPFLTVSEVATSSNQYVFLDAREREEFDVSHIPNAHYVGYHFFDINLLPKIKPSDTLVVYCSIGYRSEVIARKLIAQGYQNVYNLYGSIFEWVNQHYPVETGEVKTLKIHGYNSEWGKWISNNSIEIVY